MPGVINQPLVFVTGKGGVGKTCFAESLTHLNPNAVFFSLSHQGQVSAIDPGSSVDWDLESCTTDYITQKFKSETIAKWIMKTPLFSAIFRMIPSLSYLTFLGKFVHYLEHHPGAQLIIDAPASGHAITMIESIDLFSYIFQEGLLFKDTNRIKSFLTDPLKTKFIVLTLPTDMAIQEGLDLKNEFASKGLENTDIIVNQSLHKYCDRNKIQDKELPHFLLERVRVERELLTTYNLNEARLISYQTENLHQSIIEEVIDANN